MNCPDCGAVMVARKSTYGPFLGCSRYPACRSAHGMHPDGTPLGTPANAATRAARMKAHDAFDSKWKYVKSGRGAARRAAYAWLAAEMGLSKEECHIGNFDLEQCEMVVRLCSK